MTEPVEAKPSVIGLLQQMSRKIDATLEALGRIERHLEELRGGAAAPQEPKRPKRWLRLVRLDS